MVSASTLTGAAGEHFVMSQLLRRGYIAALAPAGVPNCDIVVTNDIGDRLCAVQVKTRNNLGTDGGWHMRKKHEKLESPTLFYCFVDLGDGSDNRPMTWVVPAPIVASTLSACHQGGWRSQERMASPIATTTCGDFFPDTITCRSKSIVAGGYRRTTKHGIFCKSSPDRRSSAFHFSSVQIPLDFSRTASIVLTRIAIRKKMRNRCPDRRSGGALGGGTAWRRSREEGTPT